MQRIRGSTRMRYINLLLLTYLLTYLPVYSLYTVCNTVCLQFFCVTDCPSVLSDYAVEFIELNDDRRISEHVCTAPV